VFNKYDLKDDSAGDSHSSALRKRQAKQNLIGMKFILRQDGELADD